MKSLWGRHLAETVQGHLQECSGLVVLILLVSHDLSAGVVCHAQSCLSWSSTLFVAVK